MKRRTALKAILAGAIGVETAKAGWLGIQPPKKPAKPAPKATQARVARPSVPSKAFQRWKIGGRQWTRQSLENHLAATHRYSRERLRVLSFGQLVWMHDTEHDRHNGRPSQYGRLLDGYAIPAAKPVNHFGGVNKMVLPSKDFCPIGGT